MIVNRYKGFAVLLIALVSTTVFLLSAIECLAQRDRRGATRPAPALTSPSSDDTAGARQNLRQRRFEESLGPWLGIGFKNSSDSGVKGMLIESVEPGSPADLAGLRIGDIITAVDGNPTENAEAYRAAISQLTIGKDYEISVLRGERPAVRTIRPQSRPSGGSSSEITDTPAPRKGPLDINTLKYAIIDPKTHTVTFIGKYDPEYNTGPIPYADLLKDAMANPYPSFSIEPSEKQKSQIAQVDRMVSADVSRMDDANFCNQWAQKMLNLIMNDDSLQADNRRFFQNMGSGVGMSGDEMKRLYDAASGKIQMQPSEMFTTLSKIMRGTGAPRAADGFLSMAAGGGPDDLLRNLAKAFGFTSQFEEFERKQDSGEWTYQKYKDEAVILCVGELCRELDTPEDQLRSTISTVRSGSQPADVIVDLMSESIGSFITNKAGARMMNGLVLGPEITAKMYNFPVPQSDLVFTNVEPGSQLGDILFKADYRLKSVCTFPDARAKVPDHLTHQEFDQKEAQAANYNMPAGTSAMIGHRLVPSDVEMRVSPSGDVVEFKNSHVKMISTLHEMLGNKNRGAEEFIKSVTPKYAEFMTERYDGYAKVYPEWHKMSEAAKIVALARWAKKNNYLINVDDALGVKVSQPSTVNGFWSLVFQFSGDTGSLMLVAHGGASFGQDEGEDWIKPEPNVEVTSDVCKQLAASTILAEQSVNAAISGDLEAARDLADKSARAMTGEIDLTQLPSLDGVPVPTDPASYAVASREIIDEASECLRKMDQAQKDLAQAGQMAATSPDEAAKLSQAATQAQDEAQARLKEILAGVSTYKSDPSKAGTVVVALQGSSGTITPPGGDTQANGAGSASGTTGTLPATEDWETKRAMMVAELEKVNQQIAKTREMLLKLNASIMSDRKQFEEWEKAADDGFDRCVQIAADTAVDWGAGGIADRYKEISELANRLPGKPEDVIEKYRYLASLSQRLKEAKSTADYAGLATREGKSEQELWETLRDGIGQVSGLLGLDKTVPGMFWKYGSLAADMAYNLTELRLGWKNVGQLEENNARYAEAVQKLADRMKALIERQKELKQKIDADEPVDFRTSTDG